MPVPLNSLFDYRWDLASLPAPGQRVTVPFGNRRLTGILLAANSRASVADDRLKSVLELHDASPLLPADIVMLLNWAAQYYHYPIGEVFSAALPVLLRRGKPAELPSTMRYRISDGFDRSAVKANAPLQQRILEAAENHATGGIDEATLRELGSSWRTALNRLISLGALVATEEPYPTPTASQSDDLQTTALPELMPEQVDAVDKIFSMRGSYSTLLLNGVTGSGKTEVYLRAIAALVDDGQQVLVLVPEISLTPQLVARFECRIQGCIVSLHSGLNDTERMRNWLLASQGRADIVIGTRSAIFVPLPRLGMIILDEEHDNSLKQQDGFRYHARDLALVRGRNAAIPVVLGSATPSLETLYNVGQGRFAEQRLTRRAGDAVPPEIQLLDVRRRTLLEGVSDRLFEAIAECMACGQQALVFLNRRGFAPTLLCHDCGAVAECRYCDTRMTVHARSRSLRCHHCGAERHLPSGCETCGSEALDSVGYGTERVEKILQQQFHGVVVSRIDRDSTRRKGELQRHLSEATSGRAQILVGTQMLAKGHHFPLVTLVGILDVDRGLYGIDFRSAEQMGQLILQVAGRAGREKDRGKVLLQTRNPDNVLLRSLISDGYGAFAEGLLAERRAANLPPYSYAALIRAEAPLRSAPTELLGNLRHQLQSAVPDDPADDLQCFGPVPAPIERIGGRYRAQLLLQASNRRLLHTRLDKLQGILENLRLPRSMRWSIDVDPADFY